MGGRRARVALGLAVALTSCKGTAREPPRSDDAKPVAASAAPATAAPAPALGDSLPSGAVARLGSQRFRDRGLASLVFLPDGTQLVTSVVDGYAVWEAATGMKIAVLPHRDATPPLASSPSGRILATALVGGRIQLWDLATRAPLAVLRSGREIDGLCFVDEDTLAAGSDGELAVWRLSDRTAIARHALRVGDLTALACAPGLVAWGDAGGAIATFDVGGGATAELGRRTNQAINALAFDGTAARVAAAVADGSVVIHRRSDVGSAVEIQAHDRTATSVAWAGDIVWSAGGDGWLRSWNPDGTLAREHPAITGLSAQVLALAPDGRRAATWTPHRGAKGSEAGRFWHWDLETGAAAAELPRHAGPLTAIGFTPDGAAVATASEDKTLRVWQAPGGAPIAELATEGAINTLAFGDKGTTIFAAGADAYLYAWSWQRGRSEKLLGPIGGEVNALALTAAQDRVFTGDEVGRVWSWDLAARAKVQAHDRRMYTSIAGVAVSPDGATLAIAGSERAILVVNLATGAEVARLEPDVVSSYAVAFAPGGDLLATASDDGRIRLWDTQGWKPGRVLEGHDGTVRCLAFSNDGARLLSGGSDGSARVWRIADGAEIARFEGHAAAVTGVAFSPSGGHAATASQDQTGLIWKLP